MTEKKNYPEEIYPNRTRIGGEGDPLITDADIEKAYDLGLRDGAKQPDPLAGFSNLTRAIQDGTRIDWERLDGVVAKCVHPRLGALTQKMERFENDTPSHYLGWVSTSTVWDRAFDLAWQGESGWSLWVEGEIPVKKRTADELELATCFKGSYHGHLVKRAQVIANEYGRRLVTDCDIPGLGGYEEGEVEVIEVYGVGTFQAPKEEA